MAMKLNDEERDILAGNAGAVPQQALRHQIKVGEFFGAADFVPVTQAHIMADTESLGEAGVQWLEGLAATTEGQRRVRIPTITDPRGTDFANADLLGQTSAMLDLERRAIAAFEKLGVAMTNTCINYQTIQAPTRNEHVGVRRYRRGDLFELGLRRALQFRGRAVGAVGRPHRADAALWLSSSGIASRARCGSRSTSRPTTLNGWGALGGVIGRIAGNYWAVPVDRRHRRRAEIGSAQTFRRLDGELWLDRAVSSDWPDAGGEPALRRRGRRSAGASRHQGRCRRVAALLPQRRSGGRRRFLRAATEPVRIGRSGRTLRGPAVLRCRCLR